ncbi:MAG TPA: carboxypeptidase-like regulatory domain-containing protein [Chitinophagaceae bacterium]|nr:carboxypeptidase-like regulatory domain-containing protein [Chitinophagaceae bacterium]
MKKGIFSLIFMMFSVLAFAQNGKIDGKVVDEKGETLMGATVMIEGTANGVKTDLDGKFTLRKVSDGKYNLLITYISYEKKTITDIIVKNGVADFVSVNMQKSGKGLKDVVIKTQVKKETINALMIQQKNLATISDGISAESIKRTPDRNTGDVLKRVSGVSIADNKFAVIRGLADRYNMAMLNGDILPSSEADRKAFSFDVFPSSLLENIVIIKAATPDRPGEFAGGIIDLKTKDIPTENFVNVQIGTGMNTISTFKSYYDSKNSKTDWLGYDKTMRTIPEGFPSKDVLSQSLSEFTLADRVDASKKFENTWGTKQYNSMSPFRNLQLSGGLVKVLSKESSIGVIGAISYSRNFRTFTTERTELLGSTKAYNYFDTVNRDNVLIGSMLNFGYKLNAKNKINFKNSFTINADDQTVRRTGDFIDNEYYVKGNALWYSNNQLLSNQLSGEHLVTKQKIKVQWGVGRNGITRTIPDLRRSNYTRNYDATDSIYRANVATFPNPFFMGRFFSKTTEEIYSGNLDVTVPYKLLNITSSLKVGAYLQTKDREYEARVLAYVRAKSNTFQQSLLLLPEETIFNQENINDKGFILSDATLPQDQYTASSNLQAYYIMNDNLVANKFRFVYGVRIENFSQNLITGNLKPGDLKVEKKNTDFLPSLNFTYLINKKTNLRICASKTLSRPEFRELSPASFYDYNLSATYTGNTKLEQTKIYNYDIRYEYFMGKGEMVSGSVFYKKFVNPIETSVPFGLTTTQKVFSYVNVPTSNSIGLELEFRKSLSSLAPNEKSQLNNFVVFGNFSYIKSTVNVTTKSASGEESVYKRPMQGQSPYIINAGLSYTHPVSNLTSTLVYNRIGERIFAVGNGEIPEMYEAPRNVIDFSISKKFYKKLEVKFTISDLLSNPVNYYYNVDKNYAIVKDKNAYDKNSDFTVIRTKQGTNLGLSIAYQFGK